MEKMNLGPLVKLELTRIFRTFPPSAEKVFRTNCLNFYVDLMDQIHQRFPFHSPEIQMLADMDFIDPTNISTKHDISLLADAF